MSLQLAMLHYGMFIVHPHIAFVLNGDFQVPYLVSGDNQ